MPLPLCRRLPHAGLRSPAQVAIRTSQASRPRIFAVPPALRRFSTAPYKPWQDSSVRSHPAEQVSKLLRARLRHHPAAVGAIARLPDGNGPISDSAADAVLL